MKRLMVKADPDRLDDALEFLNELLAESGCPKKEKYQMIMALEEIFMNIANYAYGDESGDIELEGEVTDGVLTISFKDSGVPFDPLAKEDPDIHVAKKDRRPGGMGIFMVKNTMDSLEYEYKDEKNILTIKKKLI